MNKRGFTLIELIATIALLAIIMMIAVPAVNGVIDKNKKKNCQILKDSIIRAAELYVSDNKYSLIWSNGTTIIDTNTLISQKYLSDSNIKNPCDNEEYNGDIEVKFQKANGNITLYEDIQLPLSFSCCQNGE